MMTFENIMLSKRNYSQKEEFHSYEMFRIGKYIETESRLTVAGVRIGGNRESLLTRMGFYRV